MKAYIDGLVFGVLDEHAPERLRSLTISWSRFGYHERILAASDIESLLAEASRLGYRYCFVQRPGHLIAERWFPKGSGKLDFQHALAAVIAEGGFAIAGGGQAFVIDIAAWNRGDRTRREFPESVRAHEVIADHDDAFVAEIKQQTATAQRGVFLWNVESYEDVEKKPDAFPSAASTLVCVAAGFKPNRILETHGFDHSTRVVFADYSTQALAVRRFIVEEWDGRDFPRFVRRVFERFPPPETMYWLWAGVTPENIDWDDVASTWRNELDRWGGADAFHRHWSHYRRLQHEYVACNLLTQQPLVLEHLGRPANGIGEVIWWSNAFFTIYSNWLYTIAERRAMYTTWIERLAARSPNLWLYGADFMNMSVNHITAAEYRDILADDYDELDPVRAGAMQIRS